MNWFELLYRKYEVRFKGKNYCSMTSRSGHDFEWTHSNGKYGWERLVYFKCTVCGQKAYVDFMGHFIKMEG